MLLQSIPDLILRMLAPFSLYPCIDGAVHEGKMRERERERAVLRYDDLIRARDAGSCRTRNHPLSFTRQLFRNKSHAKGKKRAPPSVGPSQEERAPSPHRKKKSGRIESEGKQERIG